MSTTDALRWAAVWEARDRSPRVTQAVARAERLRDAIREARLVNVDPTSVVVGCMLEMLGEQDQEHVAAIARVTKLAREGAAVALTSAVSEVARKLVNDAR